MMMDSMGGHWVTVLFWILVRSIYCTNDWAPSLKHVDWIHKIPTVAELKFVWLIALTDFQYCKFKREWKIQHCLFKCMPYQASWTVHKSIIQQAEGNLWRIMTYFHYLSIIFTRIFTTVKFSFYGNLKTLSSKRALTIISARPYANPVLGAVFVQKTSRNGNACRALPKAFTLFA